MTPNELALFIEGSESVVLTLDSGAYFVGAQSSATVNIADDDAAAPTVSVAATTNAVENTTNGVFTLTRNSSSGALDVTYSIGGTASSGSDYAALSGTANFPSPKAGTTPTG